jgi:S-adenosylmethionine synthetase
MDTRNLHTTGYQFPPTVEFVERKGRGHPDTLADRLAERLSREYSKFTLENFGAILRHQFDKLSLMGGKCIATFGGGQFTSPIRILVNGRITPGVGDKQAPFYDIAFETIKQFLEEELVDFDFHSNARVIWEVTSHGTRGFTDPANLTRDAINHRFRPRTLADLPETTCPLSNDTAMGVAWAPLTELERMILGVEESLTSRAPSPPFEWLGTDCKTMGVRAGGKTWLTVSIPLLAHKVRDRDDYFAKLDFTKNYINRVISDNDALGEIELTLNPGDTTDSECLYIRKTGSCLESGDEGQVGRGNRFGGLISARRGYSIEAVNGKNPSYHGGKIYSAMAHEIATKIFSEYGIPNEVVIVSQIDRPITDPWHVMIASSETLPFVALQNLVDEILMKPSRVTQGFLSGKYKTC